MKTETRNYPAAALRFQAAAPVLERAQDPAAGQQRKNARVRGVANSGAPMPGFWGAPVVVDLATAQITRRAQIPILYDHGRPIGFASSLRITEAGLEYEGEIVDAPSNEEGRRVVEFAASGMQWQMSMQAIPSSVEEVQPGATIVVNGRTLVGPVDVFRNAEIRELTITPTGRDDQTTTQVFNAAADGVVVPIKRIGLMAKASTTAAQDQAPAGGSTPQTVDDLATQFPALVELIKEQARNEGYQAGVNDERERADGVMAEADKAVQPSGDAKEPPAPAAIAASLKRARFHLKAGTKREAVAEDFASLKDVGLFAPPAAPASAAGTRFGVDPVDAAPTHTPPAAGDQDPEDTLLEAQFAASKELQTKFGSIEAFKGWQHLQARKQQRKGA